MTKKPRYIGLVAPLPPPSGGMANQARQLRRLLEAEGIRVDMVQVNAPYRPAWVGRLRGVRAVFRFIPFVLRLWVCAGRVQLFHVMANSGLSWHLFAAPAIRIARLRDIPVIVNYRGGEADAFFRTSFHRVRGNMHRASARVVPSGFLQAVFEKYGLSSVIVPNIIDLERFPERTPEEIDTTPHILVSRNLEPIYDIATAIRAFAQVRETLPGARLTVAGSGPDRKMLQSLVQSLGVDSAVTFTGRVDNEHMADLYRHAHVMVNPSLVDNMPISILEALASGVPVVSTNVGGVPYLVEHGETALLVEARDHTAMAEAILSILQDEALAIKLKTAGRENVKKYAWPAVRDRWMTVYSDVLSQPARPAISEQRNA
ncbi:MAG TPA: glycosyltransferase family 1 protein [Gammaproteobacteria bacterium]|nr:glycosyltransferase family 1 protein [Gammaproteobacteria bacterium]